MFFTEKPGNSGGEGPRIKTLRTTASLPIGRLPSLGHPPRCPVEGVGDHLDEVFVLEVFLVPERGVKEAAAAHRARPGNRLGVSGNLAFQENFDVPRQPRVLIKAARGPEWFDSRENRVVFGFELD